MKNWTVDTEKLKKSAEDYELWKLEQLINFGLDGEKISKDFLVQKMDKIKVDPQKKKYLKFLLHSK